MGAGVLYLLFNCVSASSQSIAFGPDLYVSSGGVWDMVGSEYCQFHHLQIIH